MLLPPEDSFLVGTQTCCEKYIRCLQDRIREGETKMAAVKVISLTKEYGNGENYIKAVDNVSLTI